MSTLSPTPAMDLPARLPLKEVLPGILMFTLPVDYGIDHVNIYLIREGEGWCLFDTGADCEAARALWLRALAGPLVGGLTRIIVSHHHPDHLGLAAWLAQITGAKILMRPEEREVARATRMLDETSRRHGVEFMLRHGLSPGEAEEIVSGVLQENLGCDEPPPSISLEDGQCLEIGDYRFDVLVLGGHSIAQICLYEPDLKLLLTGDQLLERITPNVGVWPYGETNPLPRYIDSLRVIAGLPIEHVLPAHHDVYHAGVARAHGLVAHHQRALRRFKEGLREGMSAVDLGEASYGKQSEALHRFLAMGETLAHLLWLEADGHITSSVDAGVLRWAPVQRSEQPMVQI